MPRAAVLLLLSSLHAALAAFSFQHTALHSALQSNPASESIVCCRRATWTSFGKRTQKCRTFLSGETLAAPGQRRARRKLVASAAGPPNWVPWGGTHGRMVDSERDDLLMRDKCKLCRGGGSMSCRKCHGKGMLQLRSRALRSSSDLLSDGEALYCDPKTGLWRAVEVCECSSCERKGRIRCALCYGTGVRNENTSLQSFRLADGSQEPLVAGGEQSNGEDDEPHRYCGGRR